MFLGAASAEGIDVNPLSTDVSPPRHGRFAKDVIPFLTGVRLAAAQQMLVGLILVTLMIRRPEGLLPEDTADDGNS